MSFICWRVSWCFLRLSSKSFFGWVLDIEHHWDLHEWPVVKREFTHGSRMRSVIACNQVSEANTSASNGEKTLRPLPHRKHEQLSSDCHLLERVGTFWVGIAHRLTYEVHLLLRTKLRVEVKSAVLHVSYALRHSNACDLQVTNSGAPKRSVLKFAAKGLKKAFPRSLSSYRPYFTWAPWPVTRVRKCQASALNFLEPAPELLPGQKQNSQKMPKGCGKGSSELSRFKKRC